MSSKVPSSSYQGRLLVTEFELDDGPKKQNFLGLVEHRGNKRVRASNEKHIILLKILFSFYIFAFSFPRTCLDTADFVICLFRTLGMSSTRMANALSKYKQNISAHITLLAFEKFRLTLRF
jgi:hypothetical protein